MTTVYLKEYETLPENTLGHLSSGQTMPWWAAGSYSLPAEAFSHLKALPTEHGTVGSQFTLTKSDGSEMVTFVENGEASQFCTSSGGEKTQQVLPSVTVQPKTVPEHQPHLESGFGLSMVCSKYPYRDQSYGVMSAYAPQMDRMMLPLDLTTHDGPIYVNAKQYRGIIRRRLHRAKAELVKRSIKARKPTGSPSSGIFHCDSGTLNSPKQVNSCMSNISGSEAASIYTMGDLRCFNTNFITHPLPGITDTGHGIVPPSRWVAEAQNCCNLNA